MIWQELSIEVPSEYVEPISYLFTRHGHGLSMEKMGADRILARTYLPSTSKRRLARIEVGVKLIKVLQPACTLVIKEIREADWENAWKAHFNLLKLGKKLVIKPSWIPYESPGDEVVIELDPGMAFGTGYHPTTRMCLEALEAFVRPGMTMLDLGTGSGILAIAAIGLGAASVMALDIDPTAVRTARKNFKSSHVAIKIRLARGTLPYPLAPEGSYDLATANISARVGLERAPYLHRVLKPGGLLLASGMMHKQLQEVEQALADIGFSLLTTYRIDDWVAVLLSKPE